MYFTTGLLATVVLASTFGTAGCCCQRKGFVMRGDWSLELNRVPHMRSNGPTYSGDACTAECDEYSCTSCSDGSCVGCRSGGSAGGMSGSGYYDSVPGGAGGSGGSGGAGGRDGEPHLPPPPQPTPAAQSRFHPVPTRPVFEPQEGVAAARYEQGAYDAPANADGGADPRRAVDVPRPPARQAGPRSLPRSNRVAAQMIEPPLPQRELEPALFEAGEVVGEVSQAANDEVVAAADESAEESATMHEASNSSTSTSAWRVKTRRS